MIPWRLLAPAAVPGSSRELTLYVRGDEFSIRVDGQELMNSRVYSPQDELSRVGCGRVCKRRRARVLIGGLGMGYSLATANATLASDAEIVVAELVPAVVAWNRTLFGHVAGHPLRDPRVKVREGDVGAIIAEAPAAYDAILLDVDNGPEGLTRRENDALYCRAGLQRARRALKPSGVLGIWSAGPHNAFARRLRSTGFRVEELVISARPRGRGSRHVIWLATRA